MSKSKQQLGAAGAAILMATAALTYYADRPEPYEIIRIIDGDTVEFYVPEVPKGLKNKLSLRVLGVDTPEKRGSKCPKEKELALKASAFTKEKVEAAKETKIQIKSWGKYGGRVVGHLLLDGKNLAEMLIDEGHAVAYSGGAKVKDWCK